MILFCLCICLSFDTLVYSGSKTEVVDAQCQDTVGQRVYSLLLFPNRVILRSMEYIPRKGVTAMPLYSVLRTN